jgi:hypothetical protein
MMGRVIHLRIHGLSTNDLELLHARVDELVALRDWRGDRPWLADAQSTSLFDMEFFRHASLAAAMELPEAGPLAAAGFVRLRGDECDALAVLFAARDLSEQFRAHVSLRDPDNPIAKLRSIDLDDGILPDGSPLEAVLVARPIYKRMSGGVIEMYPPRALGAAFGTREAADHRRRQWSFLVQGMRGTGPGFFEAEAEAMRIYRGLQHLPPPSTAG